MSHEQKQETAAIASVVVRERGPIHVVTEGRYCPVIRADGSLGIERADLTGAVLEVEPLPPPYPQFCRHPEKCAGRGSCPREIACND